MSSIMPPGGWGPPPGPPTPRKPSEVAPPQAEPIFIYDVDHRYRRDRSFINDIREMGGKEARQLAFGTAFGATAGVLIARMLVGLLRVIVVLGILGAVIIVIGFLTRSTRSPSPGTREAQLEQPALTAHEQRVADLRTKRKAIELSIAIERETIQKTLRDEGIGGIPAGEHERVMRLIQEKKAIDAALQEEEGGEPLSTMVPPAPNDALQMIQVGHRSYRWLGIKQVSPGQMEISLEIRNDGASSAPFPPIWVIDRTNEKLGPLSVSGQPDLEPGTVQYWQGVWQLAPGDYTLQIAGESVQSTANIGFYVRSLTQ